MTGTAPYGRAWLHWLLPALMLYTALGCAVTFPLIQHLDSSVLRGVDTEDALQLTWVIAWVQHALTTNPVSLYNAPIFYPTPNTLAYVDTMLPIAVFELPVRAWTGNPLVVYNLAILLTYPLSGIAMYLLAWHLCRDPRAAILSGLVFAFCPFRVRHMEHLNQFSPEFIPLIVLFFEVARRRGGAWRWAGLGACIVVGASLSLYYVAFTLVGLAVYAALLLLQRQPLVTRAALRGSWILAIAALAELIALIPYLKVQGQIGGERKLQDVVFFSADVRDFVHTGPQSMLYGWSDALMHLSPLEVRQYMFPGFLALGLAIVGCRRRSAPERVPIAVITARLYLTAAGVLALLTLGPYLRLFGRLTNIPLPYLILYLVPGFNGFRDVARFEQVAMAFLAGAGAIGAAGLLARLRPGRARPLFLLLAILITLESWTIQRPLLPVPSGAAIPPVYGWLAAQPRGVVAELPFCDLPGSPCTEEFHYMYYQTYHWQPLANGWGGYIPRDFGMRASTLASYPSPKSQSLLQSLHVRYLIVHADAPGLAAIARLAADAPRARHAGILRTLSIGSDLVLLLRG